MCPLVQHDAAPGCHQNIVIVGEDIGTLSLSQEMVVEEVVAQ